MPRGLLVSHKDGPVDSKTEHQKRRVGLRRPSEISSSENLARDSLPICTVHFWGFVDAGLNFTLVGEGMGNLPRVQIQLPVDPPPHPPPQLNSDRAQRRA